jgi:hypothetical protein
MMFQLTDWQTLTDNEGALRKLCELKGQTMLSQRDANLRDEIQHRQTSSELRLYSGSRLLVQSNHVIIICLCPSKATRHVINSCLWVWKLIRRFGGTYLDIQGRKSAKQETKLNESGYVVAAHWFLARLTLSPEEGSDIFLRNVGSYGLHGALYKKI